MDDLQINLQNFMPSNPKDIKRLSKILEEIEIAQESSERKERKKQREFEQEMKKYQEKFIPEPKSTWPNKNELEKELNKIQEEIHHLFSEKQLKLQDIIINALLNQKTVESELKDEMKKKLSNGGLLKQIRDSF